MMKNYAGVLLNYVTIQYEHILTKPHETLKRALLAANRLAIAKTEDDEVATREHGATGP